MATNPLQPPTQLVVEVGVDPISGELVYTEVLPAALIPFAPAMTAATFIAAFPQFATFDPNNINMAIAEAAPLLDPNLWDDLYQSGYGNLVAHFLTIQDALAKGTISAITSIATTKKAGDVSVSYDPASMKAQLEQPLLRTLYGQKFLYLRKLVTRGIILAI